MEHDRDGVGVVPEVDELGVGVAVVRVDGDEAGLEGGEDGLEVLGAVVDVERDLVLLLRGGGVGPRVEDRAGEAVGPPVHLAPRDDPVALALGGRVRDGVGDGLPDVREVPAGHVDPPVVVRPGRSGVRAV